MATERAERNARAALVAQREGRRRTFAGHPHRLTVQLRKGRRRGSRGSAQTVQRNAADDSDKHRGGDREGERPQRQSPCRLCATGVDHSTFPVRAPAERRRNSNAQ